MVQRFYSDTFHVNFRGLVVFLVEFVPSFCCVPDPSHRNFVFACGYVAPFFSLKSSNFVFLSNFVVFAFFSCFFFWFFLSFFCLRFLRFRFSTFSFFSVLFLFLRHFAFFRAAVVVSAFFSFSKLRFDFPFLFCFVSRYSVITVFSSRP